jgi:hypothetical protein
MIFQLFFTLLIYMYIYVLQSHVTVVGDLSMTAIKLD